MSQGREDDFEEGLTIHQFVDGPPPVAARTPPPGPPDPGVDATPRPSSGRPENSGSGTAGRDSNSGSLPRSTNLDAELIKSGGPIPGDVLFDRYLVERKIGEGGMGTVWLVRHLEFDSPRALKLIVSGIALDEQTRARFKREARIMDRLNHPNVVRVYNASLGKETAFIEMEFIEGRSLNTLLRQGVPLPLPEVAALLEQLCDVLQAANDEGIIHRDLKPSNLMVIEGRTPGRRTLKLLDFGIAKIRTGEAEEAITRTGLFLGTPLYSSPEQIQGGKVDSRSDLYSVGVLLYEMLTGYRPFSGSLTALICCHTTVPPPPFQAINPRARVPVAVERVVMACLAKNPDDRPGSPRQLAAMFRQALGATIEPSRAVTADLVESPRTESITGGPPLTHPWPVEGNTAPTDPGTEQRESRGGPIEIPRTEAATVATKAQRFAPLRLALLAVALLGFVGMAAAVAGLVWQSIARSRGEPGPIASRNSTARPVPIERDSQRIRSQLEAWALKDLVPDRTAGFTDGWPNLLRSAEEIEYKRTPGGLYLPRGYHPAGGSESLDGRPARLVRDDGAEFVRIVGDRFEMGDFEDAASPDDFSRPAHLVRLSSFYIQTSEVTNGEFERFLRDRPESGAEWRESFNRLKHEIHEEEARKHPVVNVPYNLARLFAVKHGGRLPTEAQWEFASRSRGRRFAHVWDFTDAGDLPNSERSNLGQLGATDFGTAPVKRYPTDATQQGVMDMAGNVRELCRDEWRPYEAAESKRDPEFPPDTSKRMPRMVVRGGSFLLDASFARTTDRREPLEWNATRNDVGFRLVIECPEEPTWAD